MWKGLAMKPSHTLAAGCLIGLIGEAVLLVTLPRIDLPCTVLVTYSGKQFKATGYKKQVTVIDVLKQKVLKGKGSFGPSSLSCEVDLSRSTPI